MTISIQVDTKLKDPAFPQLSREEKKARANAIKMRKLQERHARATLQETKQVLAGRKRLLAASRKMERQLEQERKAAKKLHDEEKKAAASAKAERGEKFQAVAAGAAGALVAVGAFAAETYNAAASVERLEKANEALGRRFGVSSAEIVKSIQDVSEGTISQQAALEASNKAMLLGVVRNKEEFAELSEIAIVLGRSMGQEAAKSVDDLVVGLGRNSAEILDNLGITLKASEAYEGYARKLGKTASELTDTEKKQAFLTEALEKGRKAAEEIGDAGLDSAGKVEKLKASFADLTVEVGKLLTSLAATDAGEAFDLSKLLDELSEGAKAWTAFFEKQDLASTAFEDVGVASSVSAEEIKQFGESLAYATVGFGPVIEGVKAFKSAWAEGEGKGFFEKRIDAMQSGLEGMLNVWGDVATDTIKLATDEEELGQAFADAEQAAADEAAALEANAAAKSAAAQANRDAAAAAEAAALAEKERAESVERMRDVAAKMMDIDEKATEDLAETWEDYYNDLDDLAEDFGKSIADIEEDSAKDRLEILEDLADDIAKLEKDLAKDRSKIAKDLAKDLDKLDKDTGKKSRRKQEDWAKDDKQKARRRKIDAMADEKLFQFELRQLEAEGQGNAIAAALERREIEKQIEAETLADEEATEQENRAAELERMQQDAEEKRAELEAEAEEERARLEQEATEKRALLEEEAAKAEEQRKEELAEAIADELESYEERKAALAEAVDEKVKAIEEGKKKALEELGKELKETGEMTEKELKQLVEAAGKFGQDAGEAFAAGLRKGAERIKGLANMIPSGGGGMSGGGNSGPGGTPPVGFAEGGSFTVSGQGGTDSQLVQFMATPGEQVTVETPRQQAGNSQPITINANGVAPERLASILELKVQEGLKEYNDEVILPWAEGM